MISERVLDGAISILLGCQVNMFTLERIVTTPYGRQFGVPLSVLQYVAVATFAAVLSLTRRRPSDGWGGGITLAARRVPMRSLATMGCIFALVTVLNNGVLEVPGISMPIHTTFRSSSLIVSVLSGWLLFGKRYSWPQVGCVVLVTLGVTALTLALSSGGTSPPKTMNGGVTARRTWLSDAPVMVGVAMLFTSVVLSAALGNYQDATFAQLRKRAEQLPALAASLKERPLWKEAMGFVHVIALPATLVPYGVGRFLDDVHQLPPELYVDVAANIVSQCVCIRGVYVLVESSSALQMTMLITIRKFLSLMFSVAYFEHYKSFTWVHVAAVAAVMVGGTLFSFVPTVKVKTS